MTGMKMNGRPAGLAVAPDVPGRTPLVNLGPLLLTMVARVSQALDPIPKRQIISPGLDVAWDACCDGQSWTRLMSVEPVTPAKMPGPLCERTWRATIGCGVLRCVAAMDERGRAPLATQVTADALQVIADQSALCSSIQCDLEDLGTVDTLRWDALGPEGGCAGGEWLLTMKVTTFDCGAGPKPGSGHPDH